MRESRENLTKKNSCKGLDFSGIKK